MAITALILFGIFVVLTSVRVLIQRRRTGDSGVRQFSIPPGSTQWWGHWTMNLGVVLTAVAAPFADLIGLAPLGLLDHSVTGGVGAVLAGLGILATFAAQLAMGASYRIGVDEAERTALVTGGAFRLVRNPIFSAALLVLLGLTLMVPNVIAVVGLAGAVIGIQIQVRRVEEPYLHRLHGAAYDRYAWRVGRFLPGIGRL